MKHKAELGLGTAQLGLDYGAVNKTGRPSYEGAAEILTLARESGIEILDTAQAYGVSEQVIGAWLNKNIENLKNRKKIKIITKLKALEGSPPRNAAAYLQEMFDGSLKRLGTGEVYALLLHRASDIQGSWQGAVIDFFDEIKGKGLVQKTGFSAYPDDPFEDILSAYTPQIVQVPLNIPDDRIITNGTLATLAALGVEVHTRSAFLQGILLTPPQELGEFFAPIKEHLARLHALANENGVSMQEACLAFCTQCEGVSAVIAGAEEPRQLAGIIKAAKAEVTQQFISELRNFGFCCNKSKIDVRVIDPRCWG